MVRSRGVYRGLFPLVPNKGSTWLGVPPSWERNSCLTKVKVRRPFGRASFISTFSSLSLSCWFQSLKANHISLYRTCKFVYICICMYTLRKLVGGFNPFENISQNGNLPHIGVKIKDIWNHHLDIYIYVYNKKNYIKKPGRIWSAYFTENTLQTDSCDHIFSHLVGLRGEGKANRSVPWTHRRIPYLYLCIYKFIHICIYTCRHIYRNVTTFAYSLDIY